MIRNIRIDNLKLKSKNYKQSHSTSISEIKLNSKKAFEKHIETSSDYDSYINSIYTRMVQDQRQSPILIIPKKFQSFINSKLFKQLLSKIFQYMMMIEQFQLKYREHASEYKLQSGTLMIHESFELHQKCKEISYVYMGILLSYGESKFIFKDQYFFQTMIYFISQILKQNFEEDIYSVIDSQLNRIFRTNTFNLIKRRYQQDQVVKQYPQLKDAKYVSTHKGDDRLIKRLNVHKKFHYAAEIPLQQPATVTRPLNITQSASKSIHSRSPLIATFFPGSREKLFIFSRQNSVKDKIISFVGRKSPFTSRK